MPDKPPSKPTLKMPRHHFNLFDKVRLSENKLRRMDRPRARAMRELYGVVVEIIPHNGALMYDVEFTNRMVYRLLGISLKVVARADTTAVTLVVAPTRSLK